MNDMNTYHISDEGAIAISDVQENGAASTEEIKGVNGYFDNGASVCSADTASVTDNIPAADALPHSPSKQEQFNSLIKGEYSEIFNARVQDIIRKRLKGTREKAQKFDDLTPSLDLLAQKYNVVPGDIAALNQAIHEEYSHSRQIAENNCVKAEPEDVSAAPSINSTRLNTDKNVKADIDPKVAAEHLPVTDASQIDEVSLTYSDFDLDKEMQNPQFSSLIQGGISLITAYEFVHRDELLQKAISQAVKAVEQKTVNNIIASGQRPRENGISSSGVVIKSNIASISRADRAEINRRVSLGEKIYL